MKLERTGFSNMWLGLDKNLALLTVGKFYCIFVALQIMPQKHC